MDFKIFCQEAKSLRLELSPQNITKIIEPRLDNEALFHLPFISMVILLLSKDKKKPDVTSIGQQVGLILESAFSSYKGSKQHLSWSANLRIRTVKALSFLEVSDLVIVNNRKGKISATDLGRKVVDRALNTNSDLAINLLTIQRVYTNLYKESQMEL